MATDTPSRVRHLVLVLGDQLDRHSTGFDGFEPDRDAVWMAENHREATHVWSHKLRLAFFFSAMRHFRDSLRQRGRHVRYHALSADPSQDRGEDFEEILTRDVRELRPQRLIVVEPGDWRVRETLTATARKLGVELDVRADRHFYDDLESFSAWAGGRKRLLLEDYYRMMRKRHGVLMTASGKPVGGEWNFDKSNRETFGKGGPGDLKPPRRFQTDDTTREAIEMVAARFADHPGSLEHFIIEHYWGYGTRRDGRTLEYGVEHPRWQISPVGDVEWSCDVAATYGPQFRTLLSRPPANAFYATGSPVVVRRPRVIDGD